MYTVDTYKYGVIQTRIGPVPVALDGDSRAQYFPVRMTARVLGVVGEDRQVEIVKEHYPDALRTIQMELEVGWRPVLCIRRREMAMWIAGIDPKRVKPESREFLDAYREDLFRAADELFWKHISYVGTQEPKAEPSVSTIEIRAIGMCPCCNKPTHVLIEDGMTVLSHVDDVEGL